jgi:hypothetical protein
MDIRIKTRFGDTIYLTEYGGIIRLVTEGKIYTWNPDADGYIGVIEHGGNFLHGTEFRRPTRGGGAWETMEVARGTDYHICTGRLYCQNHIPTVQQAAKMMKNGSTEYGTWTGETPNPAPGKNDEWIPATQAK